MACVQTCTLPADTSSWLLLNAVVDKQELERQCLFDTLIDYWACEVSKDLLEFIQEEQRQVMIWQLEKDVLELMEEPITSSSDNDSDWDEEVEESDSSSSGSDLESDQVLLPGTTTRSGLILRYHPYKI